MCTRPVTAGFPAEGQGRRDQNPPAVLSAHRSPSYLAGLQDLEHQGQALGDQLLRVLLLLDGLELRQQALNEGPAVLLEGDPQRLQPRVQGPRDTWGGEGGGEQPEERRVFTGKPASPEGNTRSGDQENAFQCLESELFCFFFPKGSQKLKLKVIIRVR